MEKQGLRFAPLIRVSTEKQEKQGESLKTQKKQLIADVESLKGSIYDWYEGQEHATPDNEREIMERLIKDAKAKRFDAVIVADTSRWARDTQKSKETLAILRNNGIKFYVRTMEYDLFDSMQRLFLGIKGEIDEFYAKDQSYKSIINRIERAKQGWPSGGGKPYGRKFDKKNGKWELDLNKQKIIEDIARLYLDEDVSLEELGKQFRMNHSNIHKILTQRSGDEWEQKFNSNDFNIHETIPTKIPRLLPEATIKRIKQKCDDRRTWIHGTQKNEYLFSRMIFDAFTGYALFGTTNRRGTRYYRPYKKNNSKYYLNANIIEKAITESLFEAISSNTKFFKAVFEDTPTLNELEELRKKKMLHKDELKAIERKIENVAKKIMIFEGENLDFLTEKMKTEVRQLEDKRKKTLSEIQSIERMLKNIPTEEEVKEKREQFEEELKEAHRMSYLQSGHIFRELGFEEKRRIIRLIFGGTDHRGKRYGIFIKNISKEKIKKYGFKAYGKLGMLVGTVEDQEYSYYSDDDINFSDYPDEINKNVRQLVRRIDNDKEHILGVHAPYHRRGNDQ